MRILNQRTLFEKIMGELQARISQQRVSQGDIEIKTELGATRIEVIDGELSIDDGTDKSQNTVQLTQDILTQLVIGYRSADDVLRDERVTVKGYAKLLKALFPTASPNVSLHYMPLDIF